MGLLDGIYKWRHPITAIYIYIYISPHTGKLSHAHPYWGPPDGQSDWPHKTHSSHAPWVCSHVNGLNHWIDCTPHVNGLDSWALDDKVMMIRWGYFLYLVGLPTDLQIPLGPISRWASRWACSPGRCPGLALIIYMSTS